MAGGTARGGGRTPTGGGRGIGSIGLGFPRPPSTSGRELGYAQRRRLAGGDAPGLPLAQPALFAAVVTLILLVVLAVGRPPDTVTSTAQTPVLRAAKIAVPGMAGAAAWGQPASPAWEQLAAPAPSAPAPIGPALVSSLSPGAPVASELEPAPDEAVTRSRSDSLPDVDAGDLANRLVVPASAGLVALAWDAQPRSLFLSYEVREGDTVSGIAQRFGIRSKSIIWNNMDVIYEPDLLRVGEVLRVPSVDGIIHEIRSGETLDEIARRYEGNVAEIIEANDLPRDGSVRAGATILVPGGRIVSPDFGWPTRDIITSYFGPSHPLGIDIKAPVGTPIKTAAAGRVIFVGGHRCCSYGLYVKVAHGGGFATLYAHLRNFAVEHGEVVEAGQVIGYAGLTGRTTGPHLHFEVELNGVRRNPRIYLP